MSGPGDGALTEEERVVAVLTEHDWFTPRGYAWPCCFCGVEFPGGEEAAYAHVAAAVLAARRADDTQAARDRAAVAAVKRLAADYEVIAGHNPAAWKQYLYVAQDLRAALAAAQTETTP